jgi:uncharacterized phiE125 gp8 family phage protein
MQRTLITPAVLSGDALDDLKSWLGISRPREDALLTDLLGASLAVCEGFTGQAPLEQEVAETLQNEGGWQCLTSRPVRALVSVEAVAEDGALSPLGSDAFAFRIEASGTARIHLLGPLEASAVAVTIRAGIAADWSVLDPALKQGIIRLAAFHYRDRENGRDAIPPASVAALWHPWRALRLT